MSDIGRLIWCALIGLFRSRAALQAEILVLRHQLNVLRRKSPRRLSFSNIDRLVFAGLYCMVPAVLDALKILKPETVIRWHRAGFRAYWRWKSRPRGGRPKTPAEIRQLIREMSVANPLWGAPRIHGELLKLGIDVGQTTVAKYMARRTRPPSQGWKTFLLNHADGIASMDMFVVPTISFRLLYGFLILRNSRREILWLGVTAHPSAQWIARQLTEAYSWQQAPRYIVRDRDCVYGDAFIRRLRAMGIRDRPIAPRSPWQNGYAERLIGSIRRDCLDHVVVLGDRHLRHLLKSYQKYYNEVRTHLSLRKDAPIARAAQTVGRVLPVPTLGGLHLNISACEFPTGTGVRVCHPSH
jgi:transposase InsO family protein